MGWEWGECRGEEGPSLIFWAGLLLNLIKNTKVQTPNINSFSGKISYELYRNICWNRGSEI